MCQPRNTPRRPVSHRPPSAGHPTAETTPELDSHPDSIPCSSHGDLHIGRWPKKQGYMSQVAWAVESKKVVYPSPSGREVEAFVQRGLQAGLGLVVAEARTEVVVRGHKGIAVPVRGSKSTWVSYPIWAQLARSEGIARRLEDPEVDRTIYQLQTQDRRVHPVRRRRLEGEDGRVQYKRKTARQIFLVPRRNIDCPIVLLDGGLEEVEIPMAEVVERAGFPREFVGEEVGLWLPMVWIAVAGGLPRQVEEGRMNLWQEVRR